MPLPPRTPQPDPYEDPLLTDFEPPWWFGRYWATALIDMTYTLLHRIPGVRRCPWCREA